MTYPTELVGRIKAIAQRLEQQSMPADDGDVEEIVDDDGLTMPYAVRARLASEWEKRWLALVDIVQILATQYGDGAIEKLGAVRMETLVQDALEAADDWESEVEMGDAGIGIAPMPANTSLRDTLARFYEIGETIMWFQDPESWDEIT